MSDIVKRLRRRDHNHFDEMPGCLDCEAADEIERLQAALYFYVRPLNYEASPTPMVMRDRGEIARRALEEK